MSLARLDALISVLTHVRQHAEQDPSLQHALDVLMGSAAAPASAPSGAQPATEAASLVPPGDRGRAAAGDAAPGSEHRAEGAPAEELAGDTDRGGPVAALVLGPKTAEADTPVDSAPVEVAPVEATPVEAAHEEPSEDAEPNTDALLARLRSEGVGADVLPAEPAAEPVAPAAYAMPEVEELDGPLQRMIGRRDAVLAQIRANVPAVSPAATLAPSAAEQLAGALHNAAGATLLARKRLAIASDEQRVQLASLLAEALSALRVASLQAGHADDADQDAVFNWLSRYTRAARTYVARHMRLDDPADPAQHAELGVRLKQLASQPVRAGELAPAQQERYKRLRYHLQHVHSHGLAHHHWGRVLEALGELVAHGLPPTDLRLREALLPVILEVPAEPAPTPEAMRALHAVLAFHERESARADAEADAAEASASGAASEEARAVAAHLKGRRLVIVGGEARPNVVQRLREAFAPTDVEWVGTRAHEPTERVEAYVARAGVGVVVGAIRWLSHSTDAALSTSCAAHGVPYVRLPAGNHPRRVAYEILHQVGGRLPPIPREAL